jgi:hypothetical protein
MLYLYYMRVRGFDAGLSKVRGVRHWLLLILSSICSGSIILADEPLSLSGEALIVVGAGGTDEYLKSFRESADRWRMAFPETVRTTMIGIDDSPEVASEASAPKTDRQKILDWIAVAPSSTSVERWIIFIGHGTYQLNIAKFNLEGPDLSADELAKAIDSSQSPWRIFVCSSSSSPFLNALSGPNRVLITATKSGSEQNYSRFAEFFSQSISNVRSDLDHDGNISVLEAFLVASKNLANWYVEEGRLASEQALLDDNGDKRGTPASFFRGIRAAKAPADGLQLDGKSANRVFIGNASKSTAWTPEQSAQAGEIEAKIDAIRAQKNEIEEDAYYAQLEPLLLKLAKVVVGPDPASRRVKNP